MYPTTRCDSTLQDRVPDLRVCKKVAGGPRRCILGRVKHVYAGAENDLNAGYCQDETQIYVGHRRDRHVGRLRVQQF